MANIVIRLLGGIQGLCCAKLNKNITRIAFYNMSSTNRVAVLQLSVNQDKDHNFKTSKGLLEAAKKEGAAFAFLPECFDFIGEDSKFTIDNAESLDGPLISKYQSLAKSLNLGLSLGGFHEKIQDQLISNTHLIIDAEGKIVSTYRKLHLFDVHIPGKVSLQESKYVSPGDTLPPRPYESIIGSIGLSICYDLRFPELSSYLRQVGSADILTFPSAFTPSTGEAHWEVLLRARAIENQCYVIAAAQVGSHGSKRASYGRSLIVDPWGKILVDGGCEKPGFYMADIDLELLKRVREEMPVYKHRRRDLIALAFKDTNHDTISDDQSFPFGEIAIPGSCIVFATQNTYCSVNKCPVLPGHLLVMPRRQGALSLQDLSVEEASELFLSVQRAQNLTTSYYGTGSSTISIQDGPDAGRTIPHLHVHILPRKEGDFSNNDDVYVELSRHDKDPTRKWRSEEEMKKEALALRGWMEKQNI